MNGKADLNIAKNDGWTPAHLAAYNNQIDILKLLIEAKADLNKKNNRGETPIDLALSENHVEIVKMLTDAKAGFNKSDNSSPTLLALKNHSLFNNSSPGNNASVDSAVLQKNTIL